MFRRQTEGSVICTSCGVLVGVKDAQCYNCGRRNPGLWGYAGAVRRLGNDMGFVPLVIGICGIAFLLSLYLSGGAVGGGGLFSLLAPNNYALARMGASGAVPVSDTLALTLSLDASTPLPLANPSPCVSVARNSCPSSCEVWA